VDIPAAIADEQVHGQDMRRPLGLPHHLRPERLRVSLDFLTGGRAAGFTRAGASPGSPSRPPTWTGPACRSCATAWPDQTRASHSRYAVPNGSLRPISARRRSAAAAVAPATTSGG
jgi:hypothetical protein